MNHQLFFSGLVGHEVRVVRVEGSPVAGTLAAAEDYELTVRTGGTEEPIAYDDMAHVVPLPGPGVDCQALRALLASVLRKAAEVSGAEVRTHSGPYDVEELPRAGAGDPALNRKAAALRELRVHLLDGRSFVTELVERVGRVSFLHEGVSGLGSEEESRGGITWFDQVARVEPRFRPQKRNRLLQLELSRLLTRPASERQLRVKLVDGREVVTVLLEQASETAFLCESVEGYWEDGVVGLRAGEHGHGGIIWYSQVRSIEPRFGSAQTPNMTLYSTVAPLARRKRRLAVWLKDGRSFECTVLEQVSPVAFLHTAPDDPTGIDMTRFDQVKRVQVR